MRLSLAVRLLSIFFFGGAAYAIQTPGFWTFITLGLFSYALATLLSEVGR